MIEYKKNWQNKTNTNYLQNGKNTDGPLADWEN